MNCQVLLYYKYTTIDDPEQSAQDHSAFCKAYYLKGRILVSTEDINDALSDIKEETEQHMVHVHADERFKDMVFKIDETEGHVFKKMYVRPRKEIVALDLGEGVDPRHTTGQCLSSVEFRKTLEDDNIVIVDVRNDYGFGLGHPQGVIRPDITRFRDLPDWIKESKALFADKKVVTHCTGDIRREKFSGWLLKEGFEDVAQLHGGIVTYGRDPETKGQYWDGKMYVFDDHISANISQVGKTIINKDQFDGKPCGRYINCTNLEYNKRILASEENEAKYLGIRSYDYAKHERDRYVQTNNISGNEWQQRLTNSDDSHQHAQY